MDEKEIALALKMLNEANIPQNERMIFDGNEVIEIPRFIKVKAWG